MFLNPFGGVFWNNQHIQWLLEDYGGVKEESQKELDAVRDMIDEDYLKKLMRDVGDEYIKGVVIEYLERKGEDK